MMRSEALLFFAVGFYGMQAQCPNGYHYVDMTTRKYCITVGSGLATFASAEATCRADGGHLASIHTLYENGLVGNYAKTSLNAGRMWLGLKRPDPTSTAWNWQDGSSYDYKNWDHTSTAVEKGLCGAMSVVGGQWHPTNCSEPHGYACALRFGCPTGWIYYDGSNQCFYNGAQGGTYTYARSYCKGTRGGDLASIHSSQEADFVNRHVAWHQCGIGPYGSKYGEALIGGTNTKGGIVWSDGSPSNYTNEWCWSPLYGAVLMCSHDAGSPDTCGECDSGRWYGPGFAPSSDAQYAAFICKTRPWGH